MLEDKYNEKRVEYNNVVAEIDGKKTRAVIAEKFLKDLSEIKEPLKEWDMSDNLSKMSESLFSSIL